MLTIDYTITVGNIIEIGGILLGGLYALDRLKNTVITVQRDLKAQKTETKEDIAGIQAEIKKLNEVLTRQAAADTRINGLDQRMTSLETDIRELRHGEGFIRGAHGIDREYR